jgi:hypothetical protein
MSAKTNLVSTTFTVHAPAPGRPDYFLCKPNGRFGPPVTMSRTDTPVNCKSCLRHPATQYRALSTKELLAALKLVRNERRLVVINNVLREHEDYWHWLADQVRPHLTKG